jgi:tRNA pseudouridine13 synthase
MLDSPIELYLPYVTADLPGVGGRLRATADDFVVEEIPLYAPQGAGKHLYVNLTKVGLTTKEVQRQIERLLHLRPGDVGYAGLKDKTARTTQTFSISVEGRPSAWIDDLPQRVAELPVTVNWAQLHQNKLRPGHLRGNRFQITISDLAVSGEEAERRVHAIVERLQQGGLPNYFGPQRFGHEGANIGRGRDVLLGRHRVTDRWLRRFLLSSYQSYLCNRYLARRVTEGTFYRLLTGDVAKKVATGGMFDVVDLAAEAPRYTAQEISFTAPIYGPKMWAAKAEAGALEAIILHEADVTLEDFGRAKVEGSRRLGRLLTPDLHIRPSTNGLVAEFFLPKGVFATTLLRELMKVDLTPMPEIDGDE